MYEYKEERIADEFMYFALDGWKDKKGSKIPERILGFFEGMVINVGWVITNFYFTYYKGNYNTVFVLHFNWINRCNFTLQGFFIR